MRRVLIFACLLGCGRIDFDPLRDGRGPGGDDADDDAINDAPTACTAFGPWGTPAHDMTLSSTGTDWGPSLSSDGLTLVFASNRLGSVDKLFRATRATPTSPWTTPTQITELDFGGGTDDPSISANGLDIYWGNPAVSHATRPNTGAMFAPAGQAISSTAAVSVTGGPDLSPDGLTLLFTGTLVADGDPHMFESHRSTTADAWGPFQMPAGLAQTGGEQFGSYRGDQLEVIFNKPTAGEYDLFAATRDSPTSAFGPATPVSEINSAVSEVDPDISDDGTTLFFASTRASTLGSWDLWHATRSCL